ncbi:hypothetical protein M422DRAFT_23744 [Sphaerobolus stellatus SS14]|nr:hypothetical protein M422DRAFT_23744 [Sphaerobolus stellatus SS14]
MRRLDDAIETDNDSAVSESSTIVYSHEPLDTYKAKFALLIAELYPNTNAEDIQIT